MRKIALSATAVFLCVAVPLLSSCAGGGAAGTLTKANVVTLVVEQAVPALTPVDIEPSGPSVGDRMEFVAAISIDGQVVGEMTGALTVEKVASESGSAVVKSQRFGAIVYGLGGDDTLTVDGNSKSKRSKKEMGVEEGEVRDIVSGTGAYVGATGSVVTVRNADFTFTHRFELQLPS
jgi:hypothetical protein